MLTFAGILDLAHALRKERVENDGENHSIFLQNEDQDDIRIAHWIREHVPKDALFLAEPTFNHPLVLTGRSVILGYTGHVWSHGLPGKEREQAVRIMSRGLEGNKTVFQRYGITHIIYGSREQQKEFPFNPEFFEKEMKLLYVGYGNKIYAVPY